LKGILFHHSTGIKGEYTEVYLSI